MNERRSTRVVAGALAVLLLALPVAAAVHGVLEAHEYCARHQVVEHGGLQHAHDDADTRLCDENPDGIDHEPCSLEDALVRVATHSFAPDATRVAHTSDAATSLATGETAAVAVLAVAPKTSPPDFRAS